MKMNNTSQTYTYEKKSGQVSRNSTKYRQLNFVEIRMYLFLSQEHMLLGQYLNGKIINYMYCFVINIFAFIHSCKKIKALAFCIDNHSSSNATFLHTQHSNNRLE